MSLINSMLGVSLMSDLKVGDKAPDFSVVNDANEMVSLKDLAGQKVILYFYAKDNTPGCSH